MLQGLFAYSGLINAISSISIGSVLLLANFRSAMIQRFAFFCFCIGYWAINYFCWLTAVTEPQALYWSRHLMLGALLIPVSYTGFVLRLVGRRSLLVNNFNILFCVVLIPFIFSPAFISMAEKRLFFNFWPVPGPIFHIMLAHFIGNVLYAHLILWKGMKFAQGRRYLEMRYLFVGTAIGFLGGGANYFLWYNIPIPPVTNIFVSIFLVAIAYWVIRYQLFDIHFSPQTVSKADRLRAISAAAADKLDHKVKDTGLQHTGRFLSQCLEMMHEGLTMDAMQQLMGGLKNIRVKATHSEWEHFSKIYCQQHPIKDMIYRDPLTLRAYQKPRGYAGDAVMIDYIYYPEQYLKRISGVGRDIFSYSVESPVCRGVRNRRKKAAEYVDEVAEKVNGARVFSLACGHLREAELSLAFQRGMIRDWFVLDYDKESLHEIERSYGMHKSIKTLNLPVRDIISGNVAFRNFDLVYSMGLYDYLTQQVAQNLTFQLFEMLNPGGKLVIGNFLPETEDVGYIESYMDWQLVYRFEEMMEGLATLIPPARVAHKRVYSEENRTIVFLEIIKA